MGGDEGWTTKAIFSFWGKILAPPQSGGEWIVLGEVERGAETSEVLCPQGQQPRQDISLGTQIHVWRSDVISALWV